MKVSTINNNFSTQKFTGFDAAGVLRKASNINSWQQRAVLGLAAITLQPMIDLRNKGVDEQTRKVSANRSFAKGLIGAMTGVAVRGGCMKAIECGFKNEKLADKFSKIVSEEKTQAAIQKTKDYIKNGGGAKKYASIIGTVIAMGVMLFTNFLIDAPLTNALTNKLNKKYEETPDSKGGAQ